jgi:predicted transcriptional regulator
MISGTKSTVGGFDMRTVRLEVSSREGINQRFLRVFKGESQKAAISFQSPALLFKVLSGKRWDLLKVMTGAGAMTIREAARRVERDVKAVHGDVHALLNAGLLQKTEDGRIVFPFDAVHVDFLLKAA